MRQAMGETLRPGGLILTERALDFCALPLGAWVLDVGCGTGATVQYLQNCGYRAGGVDLSALLLQAGRQRSSALSFIQADGAHLPLAKGQADAILAECSLSVFGEADVALAEFCRLLRRGGYLVMSDLYARNPAGLAALQALPLASCLSGAMSQMDWVARLAASGFDLMVWEDHSELLRRLAGQLVMTHGSLAGFWRCTTTGGIDALDMQLAISKARPGYFLLIAKKH
jgi:ubiquinone/menaquinone biosynthesis C-methylase UbiE